MTFNSVDFLLFFAVVFPTFFLLPPRFRNLFLLAASYFFYGYWSVKFLALLIFTMALDYAVALGIDATAQPSRRRALLIFSLVMNLGVLCLFKYVGPFWDWVLPFGISFYTFHAMSYTIDVYRRVIPAERDFVVYSGYVMFFPQLVAGPIARATELLPQFRQPKALRLENLIDGAYLVAKGYLLKVVIADTLGGYVDAHFARNAVQTPMIALQTVYFFAFQIYADFSGYTLIARGIAKWMDFDLIENFRTPYFATSVTDFWRRWHISLSTWLRDYLYVSLGGNRQGRWRMYRNLMLTMLLGGLWHGSSYTFAIWGGLHGLYLVAEKALRPTAIGHWVGSLPAVVRAAIVFHLVCLAWIMFRAHSLAEAWNLLTLLAPLARHPWQTFHLSQLYPKLCALVMGLLAFEWAEERLALYQRYRSAPWPLRAAALYAVLIAVAMLGETNPRAFVYFQF